MRKLFVSFVVGIAFVVSLGLSGANAMPIMIDLSAASITGGSSDQDDKTGLFDEIGLYIQTTSTILGNLHPIPFNDVGDAAATALLPVDSNRDSELLGSVWELTGRWENLAGDIVSHYDLTPATGILWESVDLYRYDSGTINIYADGTPDSHFGTGIGSDNDTGFTDGVLVATAELIQGTGNLFFLDDEGTLPDYGSTLLSWKFTYMLPGFWLDAGENDLSPYVENVPGFWVKLTSDSNTHNITMDLPKIYSLHDGSIAVDVVPEPATMLLLGTGLIGLAGLGRRRFVKKG